MVWFGANGRAVTRRREGYKIEIFIRDPEPDAQEKYRKAFKELPASRWKVFASSSEL